MREIVSDNIRGGRALGIAVGIMALVLVMAGGTGASPYSGNSITANMPVITAPQVIVGCCGIMSSNAFIWRNGTGMHDFGTLAEGQWSVASGINDKGQIVGDSGNATGESHAVLWNTHELLFEL